MANTKITSLTELAESPASTDMIPIVDVSDTSMAATGTTKRVAGSRIVFQDTGTATLTTLLAPTIKASASTTGAVTLSATNTSLVPVIDVVAGTSAGVVFRGTDFTANSTNKQFRMVSRHYDSSEEDILMFFSSTSSAANILYFGGNSSINNTATVIAFFCAANNTTVTGTEIMRMNSNGLGISTTNPNGLQVNIAVSETARSADNVRMGIVSGVPTIVLEDNGSTQTVIKNVAGITSIGKPGTPQMSIDTATGIITTVASMAVVGTVQMDVLRLNQTPTLGAVVLTHYVNVNMNGTTYKVPCGTA